MLNTGGIQASSFYRRIGTLPLIALFEAEASGDGELKKAETRLAKLERMEKNLQRLVIEEQISFEDFKEHRLQIEAERSRLKNTVDAIRLSFLRLYDHPVSS